MYCVKGRTKSYPCWRCCLSHNAFSRVQTGSWVGNQKPRAKLTGEFIIYDNNRFPNILHHLIILSHYRLYCETFCKQGNDFNHHCLDGVLPKPVPEKRAVQGNQFICNT